MSNDVSLANDQFLHLSQWFPHQTRREPTVNHFTYSIAIGLAF